MPWTVFGPFLFWSCFLFPIAAYAGELIPQQWQPAPIASSSSAFVAIAIDPKNLAHIFAASLRSVHESSDAGKNWQERFQAPAQTTVTALGFAGSGSTAFIGTDAGLYRLPPENTQWVLVFQGTGKQKQCTVIAADPLNPKRLLLGTRGGAFISQDGGQQWKPINGLGTSEEIIHAAFDPHTPNHTYLLTNHGLFSGDITSGQWQEISSIITTPVEALENNEPDFEESTEEAAAFKLKTITVHPTQPSTLFLGTSRGIEVSANLGKSWRWLPTSGLRSTNISRLSWQNHSPLVLYAATALGIARYNESTQQWQTITAGLADSQVNDLTSASHQLWAGTEHGVFSFRVTPDPFPATEASDPSELLSNFVYEPTISQVREAAIRYAEVHPDKIKQWRQQARLKALLPNVNLGIDHDTADNVHVDEGSFPTFQLLSTKDRDASIDFSITWQLGDLIWSDDQTSIDNRSKLLVQLRDDLLNELTRTYFERRRLQVALITDPPKNQQILLEKELRIQELTALIDGLTGGYFSVNAAKPTNNGRL